MNSVQSDTANAGSELRVSVVCVRLCAAGMQTLLMEDGAIPSAAPRIGESLDATADRIVANILPVPAAYTEQLYTFSTSLGINREISVSYLALFSPECDLDTHWQPVSAAQHSPDAEVIEYAMMRLRAKLEYTSIAFHLMPSQFSLAELQAAYETILGATLDKRNFRRRMTTGGMLTDTGEKRREGPHRPASLYRFSGQADRSSYLTPPLTGDDA